MDCSTAKSKLFPYVDGELTPELRDQVDTHLAHCSACRRLVVFEVAFREAYGERLRADPAPERVREHVATLLRDPVHGQRAGQRRRRLEPLRIGTPARLPVP